MRERSSEIPPSQREGTTELVRVLDTTLRDGEQAAGVCFSLGDKLEIAAALEGMGVDVIEAGFPSSTPYEAAAVRAVARAVKGAVVCALSGASERDVDVTWEAIQMAASPRLHVVLSCSDIHLAHQLRKSQDDALELVRRCVARAGRYTPDVEFSLMDASRADPEFVVRMVRMALASGATTINIADTVGCARPEQIAALFRRVRDSVPEVDERVLSFHGQNDLGLATANALAAIAAGARQVEVTVNGIGERAGNTALEQLVVALRVHGPALGVHTGVDAAAICSVSRLVEERSGIAVPVNRPLVGRNAFRHASGLHQDGVLKRRETYELIDPAEVGHPVGSQIVLGKLSGRHGFAARLRDLGIDLDDPALERAFRRFKDVAACRPEVGDAELRALVERDEAWPGPGV